MCFYSGAYFLEFERLGDIIHAASIKGLHLVFRSAERTEKEDWDFRKFRVHLEGCARFVTVHFWHVDVHQN